LARLLLLGEKKEGRRLRREESSRILRMLKIGFKTPSKMLAIGLLKAGFEYVQSKG